MADNLTMWTLIVGFVMPGLVAVLQQPKFGPKTRTAITVVASVLGGLGTAYFTNSFEAKDIVTSILIVGVATITFYKGVWKPAGVAPAIEDATSSTNERGEVSISGALVIAILVVLLLFILTRLF